ncbi:SURF1 family protein [Burkholderiales bacterium]|nr:SURF1 family protein [Burkholderiales bacterium]
MKHPSWTITIIAVLGLGLTLSAAYWQFKRADHKQKIESRFVVMQTKEPLNLNKQFDPFMELEFQRVEAYGILDASYKMILDNRIRRGQAGYEVLVPLSINESDVVILVNLGWIPRGRKLGQLPDIEVPRSPVFVTGTAVKPGLGALELSDVTIEGDIWQNLDLARYRSMHSIAVLDYVVQGTLIDGVTTKFEQLWSKPSFGINTHLSYAGQWMLFSLLIIFFYIYYGFIKQRDA